MLNNSWLAYIFTLVKWVFPSVLIAVMWWGKVWTCTEIIFIFTEETDQYHDISATAARQRKTTVTPNKLSASKQARLPDVMLAAARKRVPQATVDKLVINFICENLQPLAVVEQPAFKELVTTFQPQTKVISRPTVPTRIFEAADQMRKTMSAKLGKVKFVATTTDCWSAHQKSSVSRAIG